MMNESPLPAQKLSDRRRTPRSTYAIVGLIAVVLIALACRSMSEVNDAAMSTNASGQLCYLGNTMHIYHDIHNHLPGANSPAEEPGGAGKKHPVSWRVRLLPYIEEQRLSEEYRFDEPWDSPHNAQFVTRMPKAFRHPKADALGTPVGHTHYRVFISAPGAKPSALFTDGLTGPKLNQVYDGTSYTILIVEAAEAVPWTMPEGLLFDPDGPLPKLGGLTRGKIQGRAVNNAPLAFRSDFPEDKLRAWITKDGRDISYEE